MQGLEIDAFSRAKMDATAAELIEERDAVKELGLIWRKQIVNSKKLEILCGWKDLIPASFFDDSKTKLRLGQKKA